MGWSDEELDNLVDLGFIKPHDPWRLNISDRSTFDKFHAALRITEVYLPNQLKHQFRQLSMPSAC